MRRLAPGVLGALGVLLAGMAGRAEAEGEGMSAAEGEPVTAWIAAEPQAGGAATFVGYARADAALTLRYELVGEKHGPGGRSRVQQGGEVAVSPGRDARLSHLSFGRLGEEDHYSIRLRLYRGAQLLGETSLDK